MVHCQPITVAMWLKGKPVFVRHKPDGTVMGRFWSAECSQRVKRIIFPQHGLVDTPDSGRLFCLAVPTAELSTSSKLARDGDSCGERQVVAGLTQREKEIPRAFTTAEVLRWLKLVPTHLEVQIRRLRWWQSILLDREGNEALLGIFFGRLGAEVEGPLLDNGNLSPNTHPWVLQLKADLQSLKDIEPGR